MSDRVRHVKINGGLRRYAANTRYKQGRCGHTVEVFRRSNLPKGTESLKGVIRQAAENERGLLASETA